MAPDSFNDNKRRVKVYSNSAGNRNFLFAQTKGMAKLKRLRKKRSVIPITEDEILRRFQSTANCCSLGNHYLGCVGRKFAIEDTTNMSQFMCYVKECRKKTRCMNAQEIKQFVKELFEKSEMAESSGNQRTKMDYRLPLLNSANQINMSNNKVCRKGISAVYGISVKSIQSYSAAKRTGTVGSFLLKFTRFTDSTIQNTTFKEVENVFQENLPEHTSFGNLT
jgi:hypothetical protein